MRYEVFLYHVTEKIHNGNTVYSMYLGHCGAICVCISGELSKDNYKNPLMRILRHYLKERKKGCVYGIDLDTGLVIKPT